MPSERTSPRVLIALGIFAVLAAGGSWVATYRPDRPIPTIAPGSSAGPAFAVQIIRPRLGLPLGGLVPPDVFGLEAHLGFDSSSPEASVESVDPRRFVLRAEGWELVLALDAQGRVTPDTEVVFDLLFEDRETRVRCRPGDPAVGSIRITTLPETGELSGDFDVELARCENVRTGEPLGWPPEPLVLHGSFDRLVPEAIPSER